LIFVCNKRILRLQFSKITNEELTDYQNITLSPLAITIKCRLQNIV